MKALDILREKLTGNYYYRFSTGDTWDFYFDNFHLLTYEIKSPDEQDLNKRLLNNYNAAQQAIDKKDIAKNIVAASCLRKNITSVSLNADSALILKFENEVKLILPTNTDIVDWQWALNKNGDDPYLGCIAGCFSTGEIQIGTQ